MPLFDSITLTMGTAGTGGFSVRSNGFADYTILQQAIIGVFMMLFGINFSFYFLIVRRKYREAFHMEEVITYISIIAIVTLLIVCSAYTLFPSVFEAIHHVFFTVSSIITTTGYATVDFNKWTPFARTLVVLMMFIGACAGSTGGIKVSRLNVLAKGIKKDVQTLLHPNLVCKVRMDGKPVPHETVRSINVFLSIYLITFVICLVLVTLDGKDLVTSFTSVAATLNNSSTISDQDLAKSVRWATTPVSLISPNTFFQLPCWPAIWNCCRFFCCLFRQCGREPSV